MDEDVPGGAAAFMFNHVMEEQGGYRFLDVAPRTITGQSHRPSYGSDGDYFSKPVRTFRTVSGAECISVGVYLFDSGVYFFVVFL